MASSHDVYSTQPAFPFLASSLLAPYDMRNAARSSGGGGDHQTATTADDRSSWDLKPAFDKFSGVSRYRNESRFLFRCGSTIGVSYLKEWWNTSNPDMSRDLLGQIPKRLLSRYLLGLQNEQTTQKGPRVYIIRPSHSSTFAPDALLEAILEEEQASRRSPPPQTVLSRDQAIDLLDCVELLTIHDFAATTRAISQVSDRLYAMQQQQQQLRQTKTNNQDDPALGQEEEGEEKEEDDDNNNNNKRNLPSTVLFIIEGLDAMAENVIRNSDALRGSAVLTPALRTLTYLSRSYASFLSIVLVNTTGLGSHPPSRSSQPPPGLSVSQSHDGGGGGGGDGMSNNNRNNNMKSAGGLYSVFSRTHRQDNNDDDNDNDTDEPLPLLHTLLSRTMDQAIDIHLLFQLRKNQSLVEVVKDRTGDGLGKWCVWS